MVSQLSSDRKLLDAWTAVVPTAVAAVSLISIYLRKGIFRVSKNCESMDRSVFFNSIQPRIFQALAALLVLSLVANLFMPEIHLDRSSFSSYTLSMVVLSFMVAGGISRMLKLCGIRSHRTNCGASTGLGIFLFLFMFPIFFLALRALTNPSPKTDLKVDRADLMHAAFFCVKAYSIRRNPASLRKDLDPRWKILDPIVDPKKDVHALVAISPRGDLHVSFAGSMTLTNWKTNFDIRGRDVIKELSEASAHEGYSSAYLSARSLILQKVMEAVGEVGEVKDIHVSGHSLGGGLAQIATIDLSMRFPNSKVSTYLFGSPSAGDHDFLRVFEAANEGRFVSVVSIFDVIPSLANTNYPPLRNEFLIVPRASSAFFRTGHSMSATYYPTLADEKKKGSLLDVGSLAALILSAYILLSRSVGFLGTALTSRDKEGPLRNSRIGKVFAGLFLIALWAAGFYAIFKMIRPAGDIPYGYRIAISVAVIAITRLISSRWVIDRRIPRLFPSKTVAK